jgi:tetratricopeptide (TPR) repeat protein
VKRVFIAAVLLIATLAAIRGYMSSRADQSFREFIARGDQALAEGDTFAAVEAFSGAIAVKDSSMVGYLKRGEAYRRRHELEAALKDLARAAELDPLATRPRELLGDVNYSLARFARAADRYEEYLDIDEVSPRVLYKLALAQYRAGTPHRAITALDRAVAIQERFPEAYYLRGLCLRDLHKPGEALIAFERAVRLAPTMLQAREELADQYGRLGRAEDRIAQLEALIALDPNADREVTLGLAHAAVGDGTSAIQALGRAARRYPSHRHTHIALGRAWLETAQAQNDAFALTKAIETLQRAAATDDTSEPLTLFGRALLLAADVEMAEHTLRRATGQLPVDPLAFYYLADAAERRGNTAIARDALVDYHALTGGGADRRRRARLKIRIAELSMRLAQPQMAVPWFERAVDESAPDASLFTDLAEAQWRSGNAAAARSTLAKALRLDPQHAAARMLERRFD